MRYSVFNRNIKNLDLYHTPAPQVILTKAYLLGALHDATERKYTYRLSQKSKQYVEFIAKGLKDLGYSAWTYKEGKNRDVYVVEFAKRILKGVTVNSLVDKKDYARGYFDTEGGISKDPKVRYYIYFAQKDFSDLNQLRSYLLELSIECGKIHLPSKKRDPDYYRFYVLSESHNDFCINIGSWHPEKSKYLRMKI